MYPCLDGQSLGKKKHSKGTAKLVTEHNAAAQDPSRGMRLVLLLVV